MHPLRQSLHNELHARPSLYFDEPAHVFHLAFLGSDQECNAFLENCCPGSLDLTAAQGITQLDGHALKWERHAEFFTLTLVVTSSSDDLSWTTLPEVLASKIEVHLPALINSVQIVVRGETGLDLSRYGFKDPSGSCVGGGDALGSDRGDRDRREGDG